MRDVEVQLRDYWEDILGEIPPPSAEQFTDPTRLRFDSSVLHDEEALRDEEVVEVDIDFDDPTSGRQTEMRNKSIVRAALALAAAVTVIVGVVLVYDDSTVDNTNTADTPDSLQETTTVPPETDADSTAGFDADTPPIEVATAYWERVEAADIDATLAVVEPSLHEAAAVVPNGRGNTLAVVFDWYEVVGWTWTFGTCEKPSDETIHCTATARNDWSDALGVEPVTGTYVVRVVDGNMRGVDEHQDSFTSQWGPNVFDVFASWVEANHPGDAEIMFNFAIDTNENILELYRTNTERFVAAQ